MSVFLLASDGPLSLDWVLDRKHQWVPEAALVPWSKHSRPSLWAALQV